MKVIVTGSLHCGKSTVLNATIGLLGLTKPASLVTKRVVAHDGSVQWFIGTSDGRQQCFATARANHAPETLDLEVFNCFGLAILQEAASSEWIVIDELGILETKAEAFVQGVATVFSGTANVLAVIQERSADFWYDRIGRSTIDRVFTVTLDNRSSLAQSIAKDLCGSS